MQYFHEDMMKQLVEDRHQSIVSVMRASQRQSAMRSWIGLALIRFGEKLSGRTQSGRPVITLEPPRPSHPGYTS
jgi:hypothetical protein